MPFDPHWPPTPAFDWSQEYRETRIGRAKPGLLELWVELSPPPIPALPAQPQQLGTTAASLAVCSGILVALVGWVACSSPKYRDRLLSVLCDDEGDAFEGVAATDDTEQGEQGKPAAVKPKERRLRKQKTNKGGSPRT